MGFTVKVHHQSGNIYVNKERRQLVWKDFTHMHTQACVVLFSDMILLGSKNIVVLPEAIELSSRGFFVETKTQSGSLYRDQVLRYLCLQGS